MTYPNLPKEFPDFDLSTLPPIPAGWQDNSWHNDACPCFTTGRDLNPIMIYVDYAKPEDREMQGGARYSVLRHHENGWAIEDLLSTDDWQAVLDLVDQIEEEEHQA